MAALKTIESKLNDALKGLPPLPDSGKESLVKAWPWIALVFGVLQLFAAYSLWRLTSFVEHLNTLAIYYTNVNALSASDKMVIYLGALVLVVDGVILLMAYPKLKIRERKGWELLFLGALLNVAYSIVELFINGRGIGSFIFSILGSAIGFYLLFQVRDKYKSGGVRSPKISS